MEISKKSNIGQLVAENYQLAKVFQTNEIDFCCHGNRTIAEALNDDEQKIEQIIVELTQVSNESLPQNKDFSTMELDELIQHIEQNHHAYVEEKALQIKPLLDKIVQVHGDQHPELEKINELFKQSAADLAMHMKKEELMLFPYISKMVKAQRNNEALPQAIFGRVENPIAVMHQEHDDEGENFRQISQLSSHYTPPNDACNTYRTTFALLQDFESNLHEHIHLENNILFPKAILLQEALQ